MKAIKSNMVDQVTHKEDQKILHCLGCGAEFSGNAGDYWNYPSDHVFTCGLCGSEMELVKKIVTVRYE